VDPAARGVEKARWVRTSEIAPAAAATIRPARRSAASSMTAVKVKSVAPVVM
jgi:hypothetical protein